MITAHTMKQIRRVHHYIGVFFTPAILLFAVSGALQTFRLQEEKGYGGTPPSWIVWMASVHKDSSMPRERGAEPARHRPDDHAKPSPMPKPTVPASSRLPMKIFVVLLSIGLIISSLLGVVIALNNKVTRPMSVVMLLAGTALPLVLMAL
jgi:hypothetical protein